MTLYKLHTHNRIHIHILVHEILMQERKMPKLANRRVKVRVMMKEGKSLLMKAMLIKAVLKVRVMKKEGKAMLKETKAVLMDRKQRKAIT